MPGLSQPSIQLLLIVGVFEGVALFLVAQGMSLRVDQDAIKLLINLRQGLKKHRALVNFFVVTYPIGIEAVTDGGKQAAQLRRELVGFYSPAGFDFNQAA